MEIEEALALGSAPYWSEDDGRRALELMARSGLSEREFAARTGIRRTRLRYWRQRSAEAVGADVGPPAFREVVVMSEPERGAAPWVAELESAGVWRLRVARDFDTTSLTRLLAVLESRC
ncbi:MAG: hypothetical protein H6698_08585 [Myxococcales bacterium]|nr:hypothetical protein [Myxococcales bacterium]MCB9534347.1 hypothetical protein [Myxococcales bacterium]